MMRAILLSAAVAVAASDLTACCALARHGWTTRDTIVEGAVAASITLDWWQSMPGFHYCAEANPVLGPCGDRMPPAVYFPLTAVLHAAVAYVLPRGWRELWQGAAIGAELNQAYATYELGWRSKP